MAVVSSKGIKKTGNEKMTHALKTEQIYFQEVANGLKDFEVRKNDRCFLVGDFIILEEIMPDGKYTGNSLSSKRIKYILKGGDHGIDKKYCILGLE